ETPAPHPALDGTPFSAPRSNRIPSCPCLSLKAGFPMKFAQYSSVSLSRLPRRPLYLALPIPRFFARPTQPHCALPALAFAERIGMARGAHADRSARCSKRGLIRVSFNFRPWTLENLVMNRRAFLAAGSDFS